MKRSKANNRFFKKEWKVSQTFNRFIQIKNMHYEI